MITTLDDLVKLLGTMKSMGVCRFSLREGELDIGVDFSQEAALVEPGHLRLPVEEPPPPDDPFLEDDLFYSAR